MKKILSFLLLFFIFSGHFVSAQEIELAFHREKRFTVEYPDAWLFTTNTGETLFSITTDTNSEDSFESYAYVNVTTDNYYYKQYKNKFDKYIKSSIDELNKLEGNTVKDVKKKKGSNYYTITSEMDTDYGVILSTQKIFILKENIVIITFQTYKGDADQFTDTFSLIEKKFVLK